VARSLGRGQGWKLEANERGLARLNLTPEVREMVNDHADQIADIAKRAAKDVNGLRWTRRDNYSPPRVSRTDESRVAVISTRTDRTWGKKSGVKIARYRAAVIAFHPDAKGRKAGRMAIRKALRLPNAEAFEAREIEDARKRADRARAAARKRAMRSAERAREKRRKAAQRAKDRAVAQRKREALWAQYGGKKQYQAAMRKSAAEKRRAEKAAAARSAWIRSKL